MISCQFLFVFLIFYLSWTLIASTKLSPVTTDLLGYNQKGVVAAFGDLNADKLVDIFLLDDSGTQVDILFADLEKPYLRRTLLAAQAKYAGSPIKGIIPTDFDGDSEMDLLVLRKSTDGGIELHIHWGHDNATVANTSQVLPENFLDDPILFDYNGDMHPDLLGETEPGKRLIYLSSKSRNFSSIDFPVADDGSSWPPFTQPQSSAFVDLNSDLSPDLVITTETGYELWINEDGTLQKNNTRPFPKASNVHVHQSSFADFDEDGLIDQVVAVCGDDHCDKSYIYIFSAKAQKWYKVTDNFKVNGHSAGFVPMTENPGSATYQYPVTLRVGDYNMDGFPDLITTLRFKDNDKWNQYAVLLENKYCSVGDCEDFGRQFVPDTDNPLTSITGVVLGTFLDIYENGVLDILLVGMTRAQKETSEYPVITAYKQTATTDACFIKTTVTSGLCYNECGRSPYGVNQPGPTVKYSTTSVDGNTQHSAATQLSQSAHFALQLPYAIFGLGMTPNFVDSVTAGIPQTKDRQKWSREWTQIIPNSQLIVIPHLPDNPDQWILKLFVTPSKLVLLTGAALAGTCGFVAGIIGILHWRERREDMKEKRQESHKFHFDAM